MPPLLAAAVVTLPDIVVVVVVAYSNSETPAIITQNSRSHVSVNTFSIWAFNLSAHYPCLFGVCCGPRMDYLLDLLRIVYDELSDSTHPNRTPPSILK